MYGFLKDLSAKELAKTLTNAADLVTNDDQTKRKILVGVALGGAFLGTLWAIRSFQQWKEQHDSELGFLEWAVLRPDEED